MKNEPLTNVGERLVAVCRNLIKAREMKNGDTPKDYCFWMHHETAREIYLERQKQERMCDPIFIFGVPVNLDSKMELDEIALVRREQ